MVVDACKKIAGAQWFDRFIITVILGAAVLIGMETSPRLAEVHSKVFGLLNTVILWIFVAEAVIKIVACGKRPWDYFKVPWNVFDFVIVAVCFLPVNAHFVAVLRIARILRVLRLITTIPKLQVLVGALLRSIPSMGYISMLLGILFYIFGVIGVFSFRGNDPVHFATLPLALLSLFRVVTLEDWTDIMYINMYGSDKYGYDGLDMTGVVPEAHPIGAALYFVSFVLIGTMIFLNLFIGVIMNSMDETHKEEEMKALATKRAQVDKLTLMDELMLIEEKLSTMQNDISAIKQRLKDGDEEC